MKKIIPIYLVLTFLLMGCLAGQQEPSETVVTEAAPARPLAELQLSTPKTNYTTKEPIPLELSIHNGKFELLVPFADVATKIAFSKLTITDAAGEPVKSKNPITMENRAKYLMHKGESVRSIKGFELKADTHHVVQLEDLQPYYRLPPGTYSVAVALKLEVYRKSFVEPHPQVVELEGDIRRLQSNRDAALSAAAKSEAISELRAQIEYLNQKHKDRVKSIYLPVKSRRGTASFTSNSISLTVE